MRESLKELCELFIVNRDCIKSVYGWESPYIYPVCAAIFTDLRMQADPVRLKECKALLKAHTGVFSDFRGIAELTMITMMAADEHPEDRILRAKKMYQLLKKHFFSSSYLPVASMMIAGIADESHYETIAVRTRRIYDLMRKEHPFLTSSEDSVFAALLALSECSDEQLIREMENCYGILKNTFKAGNAVQSLSHVLALGEASAEIKCRNTADIYVGLKAKGYRYGRDYELATLGVLAMLPAETDAVVDDIIEVDRYLAQQKGYGMLGLGKQQRLMHAAMIVTSDCRINADHSVINIAAINGTIALIAAEIAVMCAAMAASTATASSGD